MGFFDTYVDPTAGGKYVTADEKKVIMDNGVPVTVTNVLRDEQNQYGDRFIALVEIPGQDGDRKWSFPVGPVESRNRMLDAMVTHFKDGGEPVKVKVELVGRSMILRPA